MQTIVLNYNDGIVYTLEHDDVLQVEEIGNVLIEKYNFNLNEIEWMSVENLVFKKL